MTQTKILAAVIAATSILATGAVVAKPGFGGFGPKMQFEEIDTDGNGEISKAEIEAQKAAGFRAADTNGDGKLSSEELQAKSEERAAHRTSKMIEHLDKDGDGVLSESELSERGRRGDMFARLDRDESGGISKEEFEQAREHRGGKHHHGKEEGQSEQN